MEPESQLDVMTQFATYLLRRIEADPEDLLEEFFLERGYGMERRRTLRALVEEIGGR